MKLFNQNNNKVEQVKTIQHDGVNFYADKLTEEQLNNLGYYKINYHTYPNRRYFQVESETKRLIGNVYTISYNAIEHPLEIVKGKMLDDLKDAFDKYSLRPRVDTGLGYFVDGGRTDKDNFRELHDGMLDTDVATIKDADNNFQVDISKADVYAVYRSIVQNAQNLFSIKWTKEQEIEALVDIDACILYEAEPYDVQEEIIIDDVPTGEFNTVTKYKNNVTEWDV